MNTLKLKPYGDNTPNGEYYAAFITLDEERFPSGQKRKVFKFVILDETTKKPRVDENNNTMFAVAVCNSTECKSTKSKIVKVIRALLTGENYDPIKSLLEIPQPEELRFTKAYIRVKQRTSNKGKTVSNITHIKRPRDGQWECIESVFDKKKTKPNRSLSYKEIAEKGMTEDDIAKYFSS
tara:strand:- start:84 stop:623 length:540 start_codon:yes stop_codon:yes gene_type:complete